jgi:hypothetical protein
MHHLPGSGERRKEITHPSRQARQQTSAIGLIGPVRPANPIGKWLKDHPRADVAHRVRQQNGMLLIAVCGRNMPREDAVLPQHGARLCESCLDGMQDAKT